MDSKTFLHKHYLISARFPHQVECCDSCNNQIEGWALCCKSCNFWLHHTCAQQKLPATILYPSHSQHHLTLFERKENFICDECITLSSGFKYSCKECSFNLDLICASSTKEVESKMSEEIINRKIKHFSHMHSLTLFNYREVDTYWYCCSWCDMPLSGMSYGCFSCWYFFHKTCLNKTPTKIVSHPFHPSHPLHMHQHQKSKKPVSYCYACWDPIFSYDGNVYCCQSGCDYNFHFTCINLKPTLKHECHQHSLVYFLVKRGAEITCNKCGLSHKMGLGQAFYGCVQCEFKVFLQCLLPRSVNHKYHRHSLFLGRGFEEDKCEEYYCDICEEIRNPKHHVYCCKECLYVAHIECALNMFDHGSGCRIWKHEEGQPSDAKFQTNGQIDYFDHEHLLSFNDRIGRNGCVCNACKLNICEEAAGYLCESCQKYFLHKACAELPKELLHPLHSHHPPLSLLNIQQNLSPTFSICDKCRDIIWGLAYTCFDCDFELDIKCATTTFSLINEKQELNSQIERYEAKLKHFSHDHELIFGYCKSPYLKEKNLPCAACNSSIISGPAYFCKECSFCLHEPCLSKLPKNVRIPSHPHILYPSFQGKAIVGIFCCLCRDYHVKLLCYRCLHCPKFAIHYRCARSLMRPLKWKHHPHDLYFLQKTMATFRPWCKICSELFGKFESTYSCIECKTNFHKTCIGIPFKVKSKYHIHPFIFRDHFIEDDSGDYYCDICEEERDPDLAVYSCEECRGRFIAHIQCILDQETVEEELQMHQLTSNQGDDIYSNRQYILALIDGLIEKIDVSIEFDDTLFALNSQLLPGSSLHNYVHLGRRNII